MSHDELTIVKIYFDLFPADQDAIISAITEALPFMDEDIRPVASNALKKLRAMLTEDFNQLDFSLVLSEENA